MESPQNIPTHQPKIGADGLIDPTGIEMVTANDVVSRKQAVELEAFMHEKVLIRIAPQKGIPVTVPVTLSVSGVNQHVARGVPTEVSRKFLEALARATTTEYEQDEAEMMQGLRPSGVSTPAHPFAVMRDTPKGQAWLADIQNQMV